MSADRDQDELERLRAAVERHRLIARWNRARAQVAEAKVVRVEALLDRLEDGPRSVCFSGAAFDPILTTGEVRTALGGEIAADADGRATEPQEERCMVEGCDKPDAHAFLTITENGLAHLRVRDGF